MEDSSVTNMEVNINGYSTIRNDRNRHGGGVACYAKNDLCFNIKEPTRMTCNTASLLGHILTNGTEKVSQKEVIDVGLSDHQLIFCTSKIRRTRRNMHNQIQTQSLRNYSAENLISTLKNIKFPNYDIFSDVNVAYADLTKKISDAIDNVAPIKTLRIKINSQDWFDSEIAEAVKLREKYF